MASTVSATSSATCTCSMLQRMSPASSRESSKRSSISALKRAGVHGQPGGVLAPRPVVHDAVLDRFGQHLDRCERRAQVVGHRGEQVAAGVVGRLAGALLLAQPRDHALDVVRQLGKLVVRAGVDGESRSPWPTLSRPPRTASTSVEHAGAECPRRPDPEQGAVEDHHHREQHVHVRHEHQPREDADGYEQLAGHERSSQEHLAAQPAGALAPRHEQARPADRQGAERQQDRQCLAPRMGRRRRRPPPAPPRSRRHPPAAARARSRLEAVAHAPHRLDEARHCRVAARSWIAGGGCGPSPWRCRCRRSTARPGPSAAGG